MSQFFQKFRFIVKENYQLIFLSFCALLIVFLSLSPALNSGYIADDSLGSLMKGQIDLKHQTIFSYIYNIPINSLHSGRFLPVGTFYFTIFYCIQNVFLYKFVILMFTILDLILFCYFIFRLTKIKSVFVIVPLMIPFTVQFRNYHDPILGYFLLFQMLFFWIIIGLLLLQDYIYYNKSIYLFLSILSFELSLMTWEISYCFIILFFLLIIPEDKYKITAHKVKVFFLYIVALLIPFLIYMYSRFFLFKADALSYPGMFLYKTAANRYYAGTSFNLDIFKCISTFIIQTIGSFPFSYYLFYPGSIFKTIILAYPQYVMILILFILYFIIFYCAGNYLLHEIFIIKNENQKIHTSLFLWGIAFLILPSLVLSFSQKYQNELVLGLAYLPVFISYFGFLLIVFGLFLYFIGNLKDNRNIKIILVSIALIFSGLTVFNYSHNLIVVEQSNIEWLYPRAIIEDGIHTGLLNEIPPQSILIVESYYPWDSPKFYYQNSGISFSKVLGPDRNMWYGSLSQNISDNLPKSALISTIGEKKYFKFNGNVFYSFYDSNSIDKGYVIIGIIENITCSNRQIYEVSAHNIRIYIEDPLLNNKGAKGHIIIYGNRQNSQSSYVPFILRENQLKIIASGPTWKIIELPQNNATIDIRSLNVQVNSDFRLI